MVTNAKAARKGDIKAGTLYILVVLKSYALMKSPPQMHAKIGCDHPPCSEILLSVGGEFAVKHFKDGKLAEAALNEIADRGGVASIIEVTV